MADAELAKAREQDLLDRALDGAQGQRGLHGAVGALELEGVQGADQDVGVGAQRLTRAGHCGGDREALLEGVAQCRDLAMRVETVLAGRPLGLRIPEAALPRAQRVRADIEQRCSLGRLQRAHGKEKRRRKLHTSCRHAQLLHKILQRNLCTNLQASLPLHPKLPEVQES